MNHANEAQEEKAAEARRKMLTPCKETANTGRHYLIGAYPTVFSRKSAVPASSVTAESLQKGNEENTSVVNRR